MGMKPSALAGWSLFVLLLFLSAFYMLTEHLLALPGAWGARVLVALAELIAFGVGTVLLRRSARTLSVRRRRFASPRVYASFVLLTALTTALGVFLLHVVLARITGTGYRGISALYPMLTRHATVPPELTLVCLVVVPAIAGECFLRGPLFSLFETYGTGTALLLTTIAMPMLAVYPSAAPALLMMGLASGLTAYYTGAVWPGIFIGILSRAALYAGDLIYASEVYAGKTVFFVAAAALCFLVFLFSLLRCAEGLLKDELLEHFEKGPARAAENGWNALSTFGFLFFLVLYIVRLVFVL